MAGINLTRVNELFDTPNTEYPYLMTKNSIESFLTDLIGGTIGGYSVTNLFQDNASYVAKAMFFPFDLKALYDYTLLGSGNYIRIGKSTVDASTYSDGVTKRVYSVGKYKTYADIEWFRITVTRQHNNFLDFEPYTKIILQVPFFGLIEINPIDAYLGTIHAYLIVDIRSGYATLYLENANNVCICEKSSKVAVDISIGKSNAEEIRRNNVLETISVISQIGIMGVGLASGNPITAGMGISLASKTMIESINNNVTRLTSISGSGDSRDKQVQDGTIYLIIETPQNIKYPDVALKGGVCRQNLSLSSVSGYTEIGEIHFNPKGQDIYEDEVNEIIDLLRTGVIL